MRWGCGSGEAGESRAELPWRLLAERQAQQLAQNHCAARTTHNCHPLCLCATHLGLCRPKPQLPDECVRDNGEVSTQQL